MAQYGVLALGMCAVLLAGCGGTTPPPVQQPPNTAAQVDGARITGAAQDTANWLTHGGTYAEERYSGLAQIDTNTVKTLGLAWSLDLDTNRGQEATPLIIDGVMYTTSAWSKVQAIDAASGKLLWQYDPFVPGKTGVRACCDVVNRGVAAWKGRLYVGTLDGRLVALDAASGKPVWEVVTVDQTKPYTVTGAPRIVKGHVLIGNGGAEFGVRGYISAYDADSGKMLWRFYTVPGDPSQPFEAPILEKAASTWTGEWWKSGGGGTVWDSMAYDPELDLLYVGTGNGSPWSQAHRSPKGGDNLFLSSIVALKPDTGEYVWHYQTTPEDSWDYTATQHIILADLTIDGAPRKVLMQAPKNGFFYVLDRQTGQLLSAKPFITLNWAGGVDMATGRPQVNPDAYYFKTGKPWTALPGPYGAHNWQPMSFSKKTGLVYIPVIESLFTYLNDPDPNWKPSPIGYNLGLIGLEMPQDPAIKAQVMGATKGSLKAWDPVAQKEVWSVPLSGMWNGGVLSTAGGLVFQGSGDGSFNAYDASSGAKLWSFAAQAGVLASPVTFSLDNQQYVTVLVGWGGAAIAGGETLAKGALEGNKSRVLTFKLGGTAQLPAAAPPPVPQTAPPPRGSDPKVTAAGSALFQAKCSVCHGNAAVSAGKVIPDLRFSKALGDAAGWKKIVIDGSLENNGMVSFAPVMKPEEAEAVRAYVISRANDTFPGQPK